MNFQADVSEARILSPQSSRMVDLTADLDAASLVESKMDSNVSGVKVLSSAHIAGDSANKYNASDNNNNTFNKSETSHLINKDLQEYKNDTEEMATKLGSNRLTEEDVEKIKLVDFSKVTTENIKEEND